jgi:transcriptional regulator with XRE-family HTH domain
MLIKILAINPTGKTLFVYSPIFVKSKQSSLKTIGTILRELREAKGLLLREVGAKLSLDPTILSKIERDERMPTKEQVKALSDFYKEQKNDVIIAWLSDKLAYEVQDEDLALEAMKVAEEKVKYITKNKKK